MIRRRNGARSPPIIRRTKCLDKKRPVDTAWERAADSRAHAREHQMHNSNVPPTQEKKEYVPLSSLNVSTESTPVDDR